MSFSKGIFLFLFFVSIPFRSWALSPDQFCLVPVSIKDLTGIAVEEKWRSVSHVTVFDKSEHALFFSFNGHNVMRLNGYELVPVSREELSYNSLDRNRFYYDNEGNVYAHKWLGPQKTFLKRDMSTGAFQALPKSEHQHLENEIKIINDQRWYIGKENKIMKPDFRNAKAYLGGEEISVVYQGQPDTGKMNLYSANYYPEFNNIFVSGYILKPHKYIPFYKEKEFGTFTWNVSSNTWKRIYSEKTQDKFFHPRGYSKILKKIIFSGSESRWHYDVINEEDYHSTYYMGDDYKPIPMKGEYPETKIIRVYDLLSFNKVVLLTHTGLYEAKDYYTLSTIKLPSILKNQRFRHIIELPASNAAILITDNGLYLIDKNLHIYEYPISDMKPFRSIIDIWSVKRIPVREELFIHSSKGPYLLIDKNISDAGVCNE